MIPALELQDITRCYHPGNPPAVDHLNLQVKKGEVLALVGESGSGKTTLLRLICGLEKPDAGQLSLAGQPMVNARTWIPPEHRKVGMVFQDGALFPHLTVEENIAYGLNRKCRAVKCQRIETLLCLVGMDGFQKRYPHELSGGERQRLAVIRALAPEPSVLLLDEPFSNLDPALRRSLRSDVLRIIRELETTAIMVTHDAEDALHVGDRVAVLRAGKFDQIAGPHEIYHHPASAYSARIFGEANPVGGQWIRPEDLELVPAYCPGAHPVLIEEIHDAGRHLEVRVRPQENGDSVRWIIYDPFQENLKSGTPAWVVVKKINTH
ncbi:MAG: ABC transporter ATP-binding protein [Kiritimatiellia bacterium]